MHKKSFNQTLAAECIITTPHAASCIFKFNLECTPRTTTTLTLSFYFDVAYELKYGQGILKLRPVWTYNRSLGDFLKPKMLSLAKAILLLVPRVQRVSLGTQRLG